MRGHHIYTRSWFELGSKSKNAGTFTVELTGGILGPNTDDIIYNRLNPMCATVPEALAPRNSNQSLLRLFHIQPDITVVSRSFFVMDEITGRGTVPYSHSLIFSGADKDIFLHNPAYAFSDDAFEPYKSFAARVSPDIPTPPSTDFDPKAEHYRNPYPLSRNDWTLDLGFNQDTFILYYASLCYAICAKKSSKIAVILPDNIDSERLILATLALLPQFMKRKFAAASKWTGMMDGSGSTAVNGLQLLCYYNEHPLSESNFPVINLTASANHKFVDIKQKNYAAWVWDNIENNATLSGFEAFLNEHFSSVIDIMPFEVIETCYLLWMFFVVMKINISLSTAANTVKLVSDSFSKNFNRYPFVNTQLKKCLEKLLDETTNNPSADLPPDLVQAVCLFAGNGEITAKKLLDAMYNRFINSGDWRKLEVLLTYHARLLLQPDIPPDIENTSAAALINCLTCGDINASRISQEAIEKYCLRKRLDLLRDKNISDEAFRVYKDYAAVLHTALNGKLSERFFQLPEFKAQYTADLRRFYELELFDIRSLGYSPSIAHWKAAMNWANNLDPELKSDLFKLLYSKISGNKRAYIYELEDTPYLQILMQASPDICNELINIYVDDFLESWKSKPRTLSDDETWSFTQNWIQKFDRLRLKKSGVLRFLQQEIPLNANDLAQAAAVLSRDSMFTIYDVFRADSSLAPIFDLICNRLDPAAIDKREFGTIVRALHQSMNPDSALILACGNRMCYWLNHLKGVSVEWVLAINALKLLDNPRFNASKFISMCRAKRGADSKQYSKDDVVDILCAIKDADKYSVYSEEIKSTLEELMTSIVDEDYSEGIFTSRSVISAFKDLSERDWKYRVGKYIIDMLDRNKDIAPEFIDAYRLERIPHMRELEGTINTAPFVFIALIGFTALLAISGIIIVLRYANLILPLTGSWMTVIPFGLAIALAASTVVSVAYHLRKKGFHE